MRTLAASIGLAGLLMGLDSAQATVLIGPLLQGATTTNLYVLAECTDDAADPLMVNYGITSYDAAATTESVRTTGASPITYVHRIKLTNLQPNTLYHYQLTGQGLTSPDYAFRTLASPGSPVRWTWAADFRNGQTVHAQIADRMLHAHNTPQPPLFSLAGGDLANDNGYFTWTNEWLVPAQQELERWIPVFAIPGNHDGWYGAVQMQSFSQPPDSTGHDGYYSFDCGDLHVIMANYMVDYSPASTQYAWIAQDVRSSLKPWKVFGFHAGAYVYGGHEGDPGAQTLTTDLLEPSGVKVFLAGHSHFYQHNLVDGVRHLTVGAAGAPVYNVTTNPTYTVCAFSTNCYLVADTTATNLHMEVYNEQGGLLDTIDLVKLAAPAGLSVATTNQRVDLSWSPVDGAADYTVHFGTTQGGPYPKQEATDRTSWTATNLTYGTTFYFVVTARDTNGPSAVSAEVAVTPWSSSPWLTQCAIEADGSVRVVGISTPGGLYTLLVAPNLIPPVAWVPVATNEADAGGWFRFNHAPPTGGRQQYYRVQLAGSRDSGGNAD